MLLLSSYTLCIWDDPFNERHLLFFLLNVFENIIFFTILNRDFFFGYFTLFTDKIKF